MIQEVTTGAKALTARKYTKWHQTHYKELLFTATCTLCFWFWGYEVTYRASNKEQRICYIRGSPRESLGHLHLRAATAALRMRFHLPAQYNEQWFTGSELVPSHSFIFCGQTSSVRLLITFLTSWGTWLVKEEIKELRAKRQSPSASSWCSATLNPVTGFSAFNILHCS